ncbi:MAG: DUF1844 domain-containing protein [Acidobacteria bacterium]|nr:DUF1844 domain-containing protein [Acidobacteriota bacterium]
MTEDTSPRSTRAHDPSAINFVAFVLSLAHTAAVHFGDVPDPVRGAKMDADLPAAQQMIDILALIEEKTRGNLTAEERQLLEQVLFELRLRYVEVQGGSSRASAPEPASRIILP